MTLTLLLSIIGIIIYFILVTWSYLNQWRLRLYLLGTLGTILFFLSIFSMLGIEDHLQTMITEHSHTLANTMGLQTEVLRMKTLSLLTLHERIIVQVGIECSGIVEMCILAGLVFFYPLYTMTERIFLTIAAVIATYGINIVRILIILQILAYGGSSWLYVAHVIVARLVFFFAITGLFWFFISKPTLTWVNSIYTLYDGNWYRRGFELTKALSNSNPKSSSKSEN